MTPVPVRDIPGYISSSDSLFAKTVFGVHQSGKHFVPTFDSTNHGIKYSTLKNPPIINRGWSSKKEFYRDYLKQKYANQGRLFARPKQVTIEHVEPVDPKELLTYDRKFSPFVYSNLKRNSIDDESALESFIAKPNRVEGFTHQADSRGGNYAERFPHVQTSTPIVSSKPVFPVKVEPVNVPLIHFSKASHLASPTQASSCFRLVNV